MYIINCDILRYIIVMTSIKRILFIISAFILPAAVMAQSSHVFAPESVLSKGRWFKIALEGQDDGIFQISYSQIKALGINNIENVGVYGFGGHCLDEDFSTGHIDDLPEIAIYHDHANKRILFYGQGLVDWRYEDQRFIHTQNTYATQACYFIHEKETEALQMQETASGEDFDEEVAYSDAHLLHEQELVSIGKTGRELYGESFQHNQSQTISFSESLLAGTVRLTANFAALSPNASAFTVKNGDSVIGTASVKGSSSAYTYAIGTSLSEEFSLEEETAPSFRIVYQPNGSVKNAHLNYIRLEGQQKIALAKGQGSFLFRNVRSAEALVRYTIEGLAGSQWTVWDVTDPLNAKIQDTDENGFVATSIGLKEYALVDLNSKGFSNVSIIGEVENQNLHSIGETDMVIVAPQGLKAQAQRLAAFRQEHDQMQVVVVTPQQIYNEYSSGTADATAVRLLMKQVFTDKQDRSKKKGGYLLMFGDGHYNNRKIEGNANYLISYETSESLVETGSTVCDDYFGFLDDNEGGKKDQNGYYQISSDIADIGIGRIPVHSAKDAENVVDKIIDYSSNYHYGNWKNRLVFLSDDDKISDAATDSPNSHMRHNDLVIDILQNQQGHKEFVYQKIYLPAYTQTTTASGTDYPDARKQFMEALQKGSLVVNYAGHGASNSITHEMLMTTDKASQLNMKNLPLWITASCDITRWDSDDESMGEALLLNDNGGAIALISTVRVVYAQQNLSLNTAIARCLFKRKADGTRYRLGDILMEAKQSLSSDYNKLNFCLMGDPSMILSYPEYQMEITDIDYGEKTTLKGRVILPETGETASGFNGLVYPTIYDASDTITADKGLFQEPVYRFATRTRKIFSGRDIIRDGLFEFSFITPLDASAHTNDGLVSLYACDESNNEGNGFFENMTIHQGESQTKTDTIGPEIRKIFVNWPDFKSGDEVGPTPYFCAEVHDESGFNVTGNNVGHDISLTIRCLSNTILGVKQYALNDYLATSIGDPTTGNVKFSVPELSNGEYELTFKVWDSFNNSATSTIRITVSDKHIQSPVLVQAFPTPVAQGEAVTIRVLHNLPESPTTIRLQVYAQTGTKVYDCSMSTTSSEIQLLDQEDETSFVGASAIKWTANVVPGVYLYRVYLSSGTSDTASESKKILVVSK